jgi:hypothetical protein
VHSQLQEADIIDKLEKICDPDRPAGEWITHYDLQEDGDQLKMVDMGQVRSTCVEPSACILLTCIKPDLSIPRQPACSLESASQNAEPS